MATGNGEVGGVMEATMRRRGRTPGDELSSYWTNPLDPLRKINREMVVLRIRYLTNQGGLQDRPRPNDLFEYSQKVGALIAQLEISSLDEVLSKEMNPVFLRQLLDNIPDIPDEVVGSNGETSATSSTPSGDPLLEALAAAPSCHHRADAALLYQFSRLDAIW